MLNSRDSKRMTQPLQIIGSTTQAANKYASQLFPVYDDNTIIDTSFFQKICFDTDASLISILRT